MFQGKFSKAAALATALFVGEAVGPAESMSQAKGALLPNVSSLEASKELAANPMYRWSAAVQRWDTSLGITHASGVLIAPDVFINSGHYTPRNDSTQATLNEIIFGPNYNTSSDRYEVSHTQRYPGYVFGDTNTIDLGVGWLKQFVQGFDTPVTFAEPAYNQSVAMIDYGNYGDGTTGERPSEGYRMGTRAPKRDFSGNYKPGTYYSTLYFGPTASDPLNGLGLSFASGAPIYLGPNINGNSNDMAILSGLVIARGNGALNQSNSTAILNLMDPDVQAYLQPIIQDSWDRYNASVPEPSSLALLAITVGAGACKRSRRLV